MAVGVKARMSSFPSLCDVIELSQHNTYTVMMATGSNTHWITGSADESYAYLVTELVTGDRGGWFSYWRMGREPLLYLHPDGSVISKQVGLSKRSPG